MSSPAIVISIEKPIGSSTQDFMAHLKPAPFSDPSWVWLRCDQQSQGYGTKGRHWHSPMGNLYTSVRWSCADLPFSQWWSLWAGWSIYRWIYPMLKKEFRSECTVKWPNDFGIVRDGKFFKLGGILSIARRGVVTWGIGINFEVAPEIVPEIVQEPESLMVRNQAHAICLSGLVEGSLPRVSDMYRRFRDHFMDELSRLVRDQSYQQQCLRELSALVARRGDYFTQGSDPSPRLGSWILFPDQSRWRVDGLSESGQLVISFEHKTRELHSSEGLLWIWPNG